MGEITNIAWCDSTFNPWIGCSKVSAGCANCYAEALMDHRYRKVNWGPGGTRVVTSDANWKQPLKWDAAAKAAGVRARVFCASLADVFEDWDGPVLSADGRKLWISDADPERFVREPIEGLKEDLSNMLPIEQENIRNGTFRPARIADVRSRLFVLIDKTPNLDWLLLTKRPENIRSMWQAKQDGPIEWWPEKQNVWLLTSVENQEQAEKRIPELLKCRDLSPVLGLSCEPLLGPVDLDFSCARRDISCIDWVICGGESGTDARPMHPEWARSLRDQCEAADTPYFFKQWGEWGDGEFGLRRTDAFQFPESGPMAGDSRIVYRVGKKSAGRLLDGVEHSGFPSHQAIAT